jgi:hypothetical protein
MAFVREEAKRGPLTVGATSFIPISPFPLAPPPADASRTDNVSGLVSSERQPSLIALRI